VREAAAGRNVRIARVAVVALVVAFVLHWSLGDDPTLSQVQRSLTPQECLSECQNRQTDCIQDCEGVVPCEADCVLGGEACAKRCVEGPPRADAGAPGGGDPPPQPSP
jgi:hypothetical protein